MAKLWRGLRGGSGGEGTSPVEDDLGTGPTESDGTDLEETSDDDGGAAESVADAADPAEVESDAEAEEAEDLGDVDDTEAEADDLADLEDAEEAEDADLAIDENPVVEKPRRGLRGSLLVSLTQAAHLKQAIVTALVVGGVAGISGRSAREAGVIILTVLTGQIMLGWHNDLTDRARDERQQAPGKPLADGRLEPGTVWYAFAVGLCLLVPLALTTGITAGCFYLASVAVGMLSNVTLRSGVLSWFWWAVSFGLLPYYLSYGGWGGQAVGRAPEVPIVVLAALLGIGIHFLRSVWGLVADNEEGWTYLPLKLALKVGATRLLALSTAYCVAVVVAMLIVGSKVGLSR